MNDKHREKDVISGNTCSGRCPVMDDSFSGGGSPLSPTPDIGFEARDLAPVFAGLHKSQKKSRQWKLFSKVMNILACVAGIVLCSEVGLIIVFGEKIFTAETEMVFVGLATVSIDCLAAWIIFRIFYVFTKRIR